MKKIFLLSILAGLCMIGSSSFAQKTISFPTKDGLVVTADWYYIDPNATTIILCHQAGYSRGEYLQTSRRFNKLGYNVIAIDLRSGDRVCSINNETAKAAKAAKKSTDYLDTEQDIIAAIEYVNKQLNKNVILLGSSFSASLVLKIATENDKVDAAVAFSPGEYFGNALNVQKAISGLTKPVFVTSSKSEASNVTSLIKDVTSKNKSQFIPTKEGAHGSKCLWSVSEGNQEYWLALMFFLQNYNK
jgi:dienelactone hydrolase